MVCVATLGDKIYTLATVHTTAQGIDLSHIAR